MDGTAPSRTVYRPSGRVDWSRFLPGVLAAGAVAVAMAWCLYFAFRAGFYLIFLAPLVAALAVGGVWYLVLSWSHCRNKWASDLAAAMLGGLVGAGELSSRYRSTSPTAPWTASVPRPVADETAVGARNTLRGNRHLRQWPEAVGSTPGTCPTGGG